MRTVVILLVALSFMTFAQTISCTDKILKVGGDFGRAWLENNSAPKSNESEPDNLSMSEADPLSEDWLGITTALNASNKTKNKPQDSSKQDTLYSFHRLITPVHQMDASWNQSRIMPGLPEPDRNGLINGVPAEMYYSIGPAYFDL